MTSPTGPIFEWDESSTYVKEPPYFEDFGPEPKALGDVEGARVLAVLGDSVTTDHISPAGAIPVHSPAGQYLIAQGAQPTHLNSYSPPPRTHQPITPHT